LNFSLVTALSGAISAILPRFFICYKIGSEMELLARKKLLNYLFLFVKLHMDPLVIVDIFFSIFHWVKLFFLL